MLFALNSLIVVQLLAICRNWSQLQAVPTADNSKKQIDSTPGARGNTGNLPLMEDQTTGERRFGASVRLPCSDHMNCTWTKKAFGGPTRESLRRFASPFRFTAGALARSKRGDPWPRPRRSVHSSFALAAIHSHKSQPQLPSIPPPLRQLGVFLFTVLLGFSPCQSIRGRRRCDANI